MNKIRTQVISQRTLLRPVLEDFDKTKECYVSKDQFKRVLYMYGLLPTDQVRDYKLDVLLLLLYVLTYIYVYAFLSMYLPTHTGGN